MKVILLGLFLSALLSVQSHAQGVDELFYCTDGQSGYDLYLNPQMQVQVQQKNTQMIYPGTYRISGSTINLQIPQLGFNQTSHQMEKDKGLILTFATPSISCHAVAHSIGPGYNAKLRCPKIKYIPSMSWEENAFEFYPNHMVKRRTWTDLVQAADTLYGEYYGIYLVENSIVYMFFGDRKEERSLTGRITPQNGLLIDQLEPQKGPCM